MREKEMEMARGLRKTVATKKRTPGNRKAVVGLDGFIDEIVHVVDTRRNHAEYKRLVAMPDYADRIRSYAGAPAAFATVSELEQYFRRIYAPFGGLSDEQWRRLTETSVRRLPDGRVTPHYDPAMVQQFVTRPDDYERWSEWDALEIPVLCLRGENSDLLLRETTEQMRQRGPRAVVVEIAGCGHAPALNTPAQFALVERFRAGEVTP